MGLRARLFTYSGCSPVWPKALALEARVRWFESTHPDSISIFQGVAQSVERRVRDAKAAGAKPATLTQLTAFMGGFFVFILIWGLVFRVQRHILHYLT